MQGSRRRTTFLIVALSVVLGAGVVAALVFSGQDDIAGAESPTVAVDELLAAAVAQDLDRAREVSLDASDDDLEAHLVEIADFVQGAGGVDAVSSHEDHARQMGSHLVVEARVNGSTSKIEFDVFHNSGRYRVALGDRRVT